jgi:hypothetical protein
MGTIGNETRFNRKIKNEMQTPGVGRYNLSSYVNMSRACGTNFLQNESINNKTSDVKSLSPISYESKDQIMYQTFNTTLATSKSPKRRLLGGPVMPSTNYLNHTTR